MNRRSLFSFLGKAAIAAPVAIPAIADALTDPPAAPAPSKPHPIVQDMRQIKAGYTPDNFLWVTGVSHPVGRTYLSNTDDRTYVQWHSSDTLEEFQP